MKHLPIILSALSALAGFGLLELHQARFERAVTGGALLSVVGVAREVAPGRRLVRADIEERSVPARYVDRRMVRASDAEQIVGVRVSRGLSPGDALLYDDLALHVGDRSALSSLVPEGLRAVSLRAEAFDGLLSPGDRVDVLLQAGASAGEASVRLLLQGALVLAVAGTTSPDAETVAGGSVVVAATVEEARAVARSVGAGPLLLALRNPGDLGVAPTVEEPSGAR